MRKLTKQKVVEKCNQIFSKKYDYSKFLADSFVFTKGYRQKMIYTCPKHGDKIINVGSHLAGHGCDECAREESAIKRRIKYTDLIKRIKNVHGENAFDLSLINNNYKNNRSKITIICNKCKCKWNAQIDHIINGIGCPYCKQSHMERDIRDILSKNHILYISQKTFDWLKNKQYLRLDFYLPKYKIAIECQGRQHFEPVKAFGGEEAFKKQKELDLLKKKLCLNHGIKILYYSTFKKVNDKSIFKNKDKLIKEIKKTET